MTEPTDRELCWADMSDWLDVPCNRLAEGDTGLCPTHRVEILGTQRTEAA